MLFSFCPPAGGTIYLACVSQTMCWATMGVCVVLWAITLFYGHYARRTQKVTQDVLACGNQVRDVHWVGIGWFGPAAGIARVR